jgi:hypothetical protein
VICFDEKSPVAALEKYFLDGSKVAKSPISLNQYFVVALMWFPQCGGMEESCDLQLQKTLIYAKGTAFVWQVNMHVLIGQPHMRCQITTPYRPEPLRQNELARMELAGKIVQ